MCTPTAVPKPTRLRGSRSRTIHPVRDAPDIEDVMVTAAAFVLRYGKAIMAGRLAGMAEEQTVTRIFGAPTRYVQGPGAIDSLGEQIGRASCRERVCQYV